MPVKKERNIKIKNDSNEGVKKEEKTQLSNEETSTLEIPGRKIPASDLLSRSPYLDISKAQQQKNAPLEELFKQNLTQNRKEEINFVMTGQYQKAIEMLLDADATGLFPILIGPPGVGKTTLCRYYAQLRAKIMGNDTFEWMTFDEATKPVHI